MKPEESLTEKRKKLADGVALRKEKRRKWQTKRESKQSQNNMVLHQRKQWFQAHSSFAIFVTEQDMSKAQALSGSDDGSNVEAKRIALAEDLAPYFNIRENQKLYASKSIVRENRKRRLFIAEGTETVRLLLRQFIRQSDKPSDLHLDKIKVESIFVKPSVLFDEPTRLLSELETPMSSEDTGQQNNIPDSSKCVCSNFRVLVGESEKLLSKVAGFSISRGALACGVCPEDRTEEWLDSFLKRRLVHRRELSLRILALDGICDTANLGSIIRTASVMGVHVVVLSKDTCDVWYRRTIRTSMGHVFLIPVVRVSNLSAFLRKWCSNSDHAKTHIASYAAVVQKEGARALCSLPNSCVELAWCCIVGNEGSGISKEVLRACSKRIRIDMVDGADSLSVPIATGILLHGLRERERTAETVQLENKAE